MARLDTAMPARYQRDMGRWRRLAKLVGVVVAAMSAVGFMAGWMLFQHIPGWYRPAVVGADEVEAVWGDWLKAVDGLNERMSLAREPFEWSVSESQLNRWLAIREAKWPLAREWLPENFSDPQILIQSNGLRLGAVCQRGSLRFVISADLWVGVVNDRIAVRLKRMSAGSLQLPKSWVRQELAALDGGFLRRKATKEPADEHAPLPRLADLPDGVLVPNRWVWWNPKRAFRVTGIRCGSGRISVTFDPEP